jgi:AbrB family looped-hinge helix DNA binding protein
MAEPRRRPTPAGSQARTGRAPAARPVQVEAGLRDAHRTVEALARRSGPAQQARIWNNPAFRKPGIVMDIVRLGKKGQVSLPAAVLRKLGIEGSATLLVEATEDGAVILRPAGVYPIEIYSDARLEEFAQADRLSPENAKRARLVLRRRRR